MKRFFDDGRNEGNMVGTGYDQNTILQAVHTKWAGNTVHFVNETDSTNNWVRTLAAEGAPHGTLAVTESQTAGKGRLGRNWKTEEGSAVTMTLLLRPDFAPEYAPMLTLVMGLSVGQAVEQMGIAASIKWPNDVVVSRKKICGILTEMALEGSAVRYVAIGVGINVNTEAFGEEIQDKATSLYLETGRTYDRNRIIGLVMERFEKNYEKFVQTCSMKPLLEAYNALLVNREQPVRVLDARAPFEGTAHGINEKGELLVEKENGEMVCVLAGEVSVRGLYSYV